MKSILLVEDSPMLGRLTKAKLEKHLSLPVTWVKSWQETQDLLAEDTVNFNMAVLDFNLQDAPHGEVIDTVIDKGIPSFVFTADVSEEVRNYVWSKKVADYILKDAPYSLDYLINAIRQLDKNAETLVLVVDASDRDRTMLSELLYVRQFRVITATNGEKALEILAKYPEIAMVICDYDLKKYDGCELCRRIRETRSQDELVVIGTTSLDDNNIGANFFKSGADDFVHKTSFLVEEFYTRIDRCLKTVALISHIRDSSARDFLTGLYNRSFFFRTGVQMLEAGRIKDDRFACCMLDIDRLKKVNDKFGYEIGDDVIRNIGSLIQEHLGEDSIVARFGGEQFSILTPFSEKEKVIDRFEQLRYLVETTAAAHIGEKEPVYVTCSIGMCLTMEDSLDAMLELADIQLYSAKSTGKNKVACQAG